MPSFGRPDPHFNYNLAAEKAAIKSWFEHRHVPESQPHRLLLASWNIANLGEQKRDARDLKLIAFLLSRFDLIAAQEIKDNLGHFEEVVKTMGDDYEWIVNDTAGNNERLGFIFRKGKVEPGRLFGEIALPEKDFPSHTVIVPYTYRRKNYVEVYYQLEFTPFDRNPFLGHFRCGGLDFTLVNVHLYFGSFRNSSKVEERAKYARRVLEIYTLAKWSKNRARSENAYDNDIILVGDMNIPKMANDDTAFQALLKSGLRPINVHSKAGGSNLDGSKTYDQIAITPTGIRDRMLGNDIFDFDNAVFKKKWNALKEKWGEEKANREFNKYIRFHLSDHRLLWMQFDTTK
ncbi:MAG: endonuclease/exonuclease/phosphatase family protein [Deltaproteobacteria bacterium]|nr:endonuclease/exonuclease/phosphatase family protein [Deltaproteobacteria bacterium]